MKTILIYIHLAVVIHISAQITELDSKVFKLVGAVFGLWAMIFAFIYAFYSLWQIFMR